MRRLASGRPRTKGKVLAPSPTRTPGRHRSGTGAAAPGRIASLDLYRALAILAVVGIHVTGHALPSLLSGEWTAVALVNRALQFAVPAFLTLSAFLNVRPLIRHRGIGEYARKRGLRALWPYVLWSLLYALFRFREDPGGLTLEQLRAWLLTGNAYYHLYFLLVVVQLYVLLPFVAWLFRKRPTFGETAIVTVFVQLAVFLLNRRYGWFPEPGSVILWYLPSVAMGCWLATRADRLGAVTRHSARLALVVTIAAAAVYLPQGLALVGNQPLNAFIIQASLWVYAPGAAFLLLALSERMAGSPVSRLLDPVGARSLEIYLVHPLVIWALDETLPAAILSPKAAMPVYFVACVAVPMALASLLERLRLSRLAWGLDPVPCPPRQKRGGP